MDLVVLLDVFSHFRGVCRLKRALGHIALEVTGILVANAFAMLRGLWEILNKVRSKVKTKKLTVVLSDENRHTRAVI